MTEEVHALRVIHVSYHTKKKPSADGSGRKQQTDPVIEIYGRTREGKSITVLYEGFVPYFHMEKNVEALDVIKNSARLSKRILWDRIEEIELEYERKIVPCWKIYVEIPAIVRNVRDRVDHYYTDEEGVGKRKPHFFSADIQFGLRFIYDMDLNACVEASGEAVYSPMKTNHPLYSKYTTDIVLNAEIVVPTEDFQVDLCVLGFDIEASITRQVMLCLCAVVRRSDGTKKKYELIGTERGILREFQRVIQEEDPDVITGYNINGYDIPHLRNRCESNFIQTWKVGRNLGNWRQKDVKAGTIWTTPGRIIADAWAYVRTMKKFPRETLQYVSENLLGKSKLDVDAKSIDAEWESDRKKVIDYCTIDAELAMEVLDKLGVVNQFSDMATVSYLPLATIFEGHSSRNLDSLLIRKADARGFAIPCNTTYTEDEADQIKGATVLDYEAGVHRWVIVLDYKALYPTTMMAHNLCFSTYDPEEGTIVSPIGAKFLDPSVRKGIIPELIETLQDDRDRYKAARMIPDPTNPDKKIKGPDFAYYNRLQNAVKIQSNSVYGLLTAGFYRFTNKDIGGSITGYGRQALDEVHTWLLNNDYDVVFGDTDSVGILSPIPTLEGCIEIGKDIASKFTRDGYVLEFEKVLKVWFTHGKKKRYYSLSVWEENILETPEEYSRGYEIRRTDSFEFAVNAQRKLFTILTNKTPEKAIEYAKKKVEMVKDGNAGAAALAISKRCKPFKDYSNADAMQQVQAAKKLEKMGYPFTPYMKVSYIVVDSKAKPQRVEPFIDGQPFRFTPDWGYYTRRVSETLGRVTEVLGWKDQDLVLGNRQGTLDKYVVS